MTISYSKAYWSVQDYTHTQTSGKDTNVCKCENDYQSWNFKDNGENPIQTFLSSLQSSIVDGNMFW